MKYPRSFDGRRTNWEDTNEVIAAKIAKLLGLKTIQAEIAYRNNRRGCLMRHFIGQFAVDYGETGASLLSAEFGTDYKSLKESNLKSDELTERSFALIQNFSYFKNIKFDFIAMNIFDVLIGNQDRHPYNWQILFADYTSFFGPLYDNGASLGWQLSDSELKVMLEQPSRLNRFFKNTKVKAGLFEDKQPPLQAKHLLNYLKANHMNEVLKVEKMLQHFDMNQYCSFIKEFPLISLTRKEFLIRLIEFRMKKILQIINEEVE